MNVEELPYEVLLLLAHVTYMFIAISLSLKGPFMKILQKFLSGYHKDKP